MANASEPMTKSCVLFRAANLKALDYPFDAALASAMAICDDAVIIVGQSQDNTLAWVMDLAAEYGARIKIVRDTLQYDLGWQERWWDLAASHTQAEWLLWLDADEVIDPVYAPALLQLMQEPELSLIRFPFVHLYATTDYRLDFHLRQNTRLGRRSAGFRMRNWRTPQQPGGAACQMVCMQDGTEVNAHTRIAPLLHEANFPILHYGWCRNAVALAMSQRKQAAWYQDGDGLEDGRLPATVAPHDFELAKHLQSGRAQRYEDAHPDVMQRWFRAHRWRWQQIEHQAMQTVVSA